MKTNSRNQIFPAIAARDAFRELTAAISSNRFAARLADEGLSGKCRSLETLAARVRSFTNPDSMERPYFSEIDVMMDEAQNFAPLFYLCDRHGFERPARIDFHGERLRLRAALTDQKNTLQQMEQRLAELDALCGDVEPPQMVGGVAYLFDKR